MGHSDADVGTGKETHLSADVQFGGALHDERHRAEIFAVLVIPPKQLQIRSTQGASGNTYGVPRTPSDQGVKLEQIIRRFPGGWGGQRGFLEFRILGPGSDLGARP